MWDGSEVEMGEEEEAFVPRIHMSQLAARKSGTQTRIEPLSQKPADVETRPITDRIPRLNGPPENVLNSSGTR